MGPVRRLYAYVIDTVVRAVLAALLSIPLVALTGFGDLGEGIASGLGLLLLFGMEWGYFTLFEALWSGRTPGKRFVGIRVVRETGQPIDASAAILRNLLRAADFVPMGYALGLVVMGRDRHFRRLGDMAASTMVVVEERRRMATRYVMNPPPSADELAWLGPRADLELDEVQAIDLLLRREHALPPVRTVELAELLAPALAERAGLEYTDPVRFLALMHHKATRRKGFAA